MCAVPRIICAFIALSVMCLSSAHSAPLNDFAVIEEKALSGTDGVYVARHPDDRLGQSIDVGQKLLLEKISGEGEARLFISNSSQALRIQGNVITSSSTSADFYDSNGDGKMTPIDILQVINNIELGYPYAENLDHNGDGIITPVDALLVINAIQRRSDKDSASTQARNVGAPITNLPGAGIPSVRLIPDADVVSVGTVIMDFDTRQDLTRINFEGIGIDLTNRDGEAFVMNALYNAPGGTEGEIHIDVYSDEDHHSRCVVRLSDDTTGIDVESSQAVVGVSFDDCIARGEAGGVNFSNVGAIVVSLNATRVAGAQFLISKFRTDAATLCNVEDCGLVRPDVSVPPSSVPPSSPPPSSVPPSSIPPSSPPPSSPPPSQPQSRCDIFQIDSIQASFGRWGFAGTTNIRADEWIEKVSGVPEATCVNNKLQGIIDYCISTQTRTLNDRIGRYMTREFNDCMTHQADLAFGTRNIQTLDAWMNRTLSDGSSARYKGELWYEPTTYFVDVNCNPVSSSSVDLSKLCGKASYYVATYSSPISLILDENYDMSSNSTVVTFPLDKEAKVGTKYEWKASSVSPLLVYDPEHVGQITSADQLFGDWTFGGRKQKDGSFVKWSNGYDALATLDANANGIIDGEELEDLGVWFDANQNGVSEKGEVISAKEWGLKELSYRDYTFKIISGDYELSSGFTRAISDKEQVSGKTIDWFAKQLNPNSQTTATIAPSYSSEAKDKNRKGGEFSVGSDASGVWKWKMKTDLKADTRVIPEGILSLYMERNHLSGVSIIHNPFEAGNATVSSMINLYPVSGEVDPDGVLSFETRITDDETIYSEVRIDSNGVMHGKSTRRITKNKKTITIRYAWTANRV